jgi:hypothetical protein
VNVIDDESREDGPNLGPDERDRDLMDGTWERQYYSGRRRVRDWNALLLGVSLLVLAGILVPVVLVVF